MCRLQPSRARRVYPRACRGNPINRQPLSRPPPVYPRACGGTWRGLGEGVRPLVEPLDGDLSPRLPGEPAQAACKPEAADHGSIPAPAGEPALRPSRSFTKRGLSPRLRGNRRHGLVSGYPRPVYPRACGGTGEGVSLARRIGGLSPRLRGNRGRRISGLAHRRSIPAPAGEPATA